MSEEKKPRDFNPTVIEEFRANDGVVGGMFKDTPMVLLTTTGAKTGRTHTTPLAYGTDGDRLFVIAADAGAPSHPAWYHNAVANPEVTVERGRERFAAKALAAAPGERDRLFEAMAKFLPGFRDYQAKAGRVLPVVILERS